MLTKFRAQEMRNLKGNCLTRWSEECIQSGPFLCGSMPCFSGRSMRLTVCDQTSWLIPASTIFLGPASTTTPITH